MRTKFWWWMTLGLLFFNLGRFWPPNNHLKTKLQTPSATSPSSIQTVTVTGIPRTLSLTEHLNLNVPVVWQIKSPRPNQWWLVVNLEITAARDCSRWEVTDCQFDPNWIQVYLAGERLIAQRLPNFYVPGLVPRQLTAQRLAGNNLLTGQLFFVHNSTNDQFLTIQSLTNPQQQLHLSIQPYTPTIVQHNLTTTPQAVPTIVGPLSLL